MVSPREFTRALQNLGEAFGRPLSAPLILQYYNVFGVLTDRHLDALIKWAIEYLDTPFPTIARLRKYAVEQQWFPRPARNPENTPVIVDCPKCGGSFAVMRDRLFADAKEGIVYDCVNHDRWECPVTFSAASLIQEMGLK